MSYKATYGGGDEDDGTGMRFTGKITKTGAGQGQGQGQWGEEETKWLIRIRGELERDSNMASKRSKALWDAVSFRMLQRGFSRTPDQCKCKWKTLLNRYKGAETSENGRQCPFFDELHALFAEREKSVQRLLVESEVRSIGSKKRMKKPSAGQSSEEFSEYEDGEEEDESVEGTLVKSNPQKRKAERITSYKSLRKIDSASPSGDTSIHAMLREFLQQQQNMEMQWREMMERRAYEQQLFEQEWRRSMEKIERERIMAEQDWRESEEERRIREEKRAENRDALLTILLKRHISENNP